MQPLLNRQTISNSLDFHLSFLFLDYKIEFFIGNKNFQEIGHSFIIYQ